MASELDDAWQPRWEFVKELGKGGQGKVDLVVNRSRVGQKHSARHQIIAGIQDLSPRARSEEAIALLPTAAEDFARAVQDLTREPLPNELGALKQLHIPQDPAEAQQAEARFRTELKALRELQGQPAILKMLEGNEARHWMVSEYHPGGTLEKHPDRFQGDVLGALRAFEPLVEAVAQLHEKRIIHRDIKPANVFIAADGRLVLGDFGIVFWQDAQHTRLTDTYGERVGSRDWMAPWANRGRRLGEIKPSFDLFPLGKLLWAMISGEAELPYWYWNNPDYDLQKRFPERRSELYWISTAIWGRTVVEHETQQDISARDLRDVVHAIIRVIERGGQPMSRGERPCRVCGNGHYRDLQRGDPQLMPVAGKVRAQVCDNCGHIDFFQFGDVPNAWRTLS